MSELGGFARSELGAFIRSELGVRDGGKGLPAGLWANKTTSPLVFSVWNENDLTWKNYDYSKYGNTLNYQNSQIYIQSPTGGGAGAGGAIWTGTQSYSNWFLKSGEWDLIQQKRSNRKIMKKETLASTLPYNTEYDRQTGYLIVGPQQAWNGTEIVSWGPGFDIGYKGQWIGDVGYYQVGSDLYKYEAGGWSNLGFPGIGLGSFIVYNDTIYGFDDDNKMYSYSGGWSAYLCDIIGAFVFCAAADSLLYFAGNFTSIVPNGGAPVISRGIMSYNGTTFSGLGTGIDNSQVNNIYVVGSKAYIFGAFTSVDTGTAIDGMAYYDGSWNDMGIGPYLDGFTANANIPGPVLSPTGILYIPCSRVYPESNLIAWDTVNNSEYTAIQADMPDEIEIHGFPIVEFVAY